MRKIAVILPIFLAVFLWTLTASAQQQPMPSRSGKYESIQVGEVVWELGQPSGGKITVTWKLTNTGERPSGPFALDHAIALGSDFKRKG